MAFGVAKGFGLEDMLEAQLVDKIPGQEEVILRVIAFAHALLENTKGGMVAGIGLLFLFWTIIKLLGNIERAFKGEKTVGDALGIASSLYRNLGMSFVEFARLGKAGPGCIGENVSFEGLGNIEDGLRAGRGVVFLSAHYGNWELLSAALAWRGYRLSAVARPLDNPYINAYIEGLRTAPGNEIIEKKNAARKMVELLKANRILGILLDQRSSRKEGVEVEFFGIPALTSKGLAAIVARTGSAVVPVFIRRVEGGSRHVVMCDPPLALSDTGDKDFDIKENTRRFTAAIEKYIRLYPDQWFWFHSRWERRKRRGSGA